MRRYVAMAVVAAVTMVSPVAAFAQETDQPVNDRPVTHQPVTDEATDRRHDFDGSKQRALAAIDKRLEAIDRAEQAVETNGHLKPNHAAQLGAELAKHERELIDLRSDIEAAETRAELAELVPLIVTEHWVFAMLIPKTKLVIGADVVDDAVERANEFGETVQDVIDRLSEAGVDMTAAQAELDAALGAVADADAAAAGVPGAVLPIGPEDMPGASETIRAAKADLDSAASSLRSAHAHFAAAVELIRQSFDGLTDL